MHAIFSFYNNRRKQRGFVAVSFAVMITAMVGFAGLAVDAGYMEWNKRRVQLAADAAAMGALRELELGHSSDLLTSAGRNDAGLNGFTNGTNNTTVTIANPPASGSYSGNAHAVQAVVTHTFPTLFMRMFGQNSMSITAKATGQTTTAAGSIGGCIFALNKNISSALKLAGNLTVTTQCSSVVESTSTSAFVMTGNSTLNLGHQAQVGVVGNWSLGGASSIQDNSVSPAVPRSPVNIQDPGDPFASMATPSISNIGNTTIRVASGGVTYSKTNVPTNNQIQPGIYCGGIKLGDSNGVTYTFMPGVYVLAGGGLSVTSAGTIATGTGVTFYSTGTGGTAYSAWGCPNSSYSPMGLSGQGTLTFKAPTSGTFVGMLFFTDRTLGATGGQFDQIVGGSGCTFDGALYFKSGNLKFAGNSSTTGYLVLVADNITINGTSAIGNNYTSLSNPNPFAPYATGGGLVE